MGRNSAEQLIWVGWVGEGCSLCSPLLCLSTEQAAGEHGDRAIRCLLKGILKQVEKRGKRSVTPGPQRNKGAVARGPSAGGTRRNGPERGVLALPLHAMNYASPAFHQQPSRANGERL